MAGTVHPEKKGLAAGWYQAGNVGGMGFGGGAGIWLSTHYSYQLAIIVLCLIMALCMLTLYFVAPVQADNSKKLTDRFKLLFTDLKSLLRSRMVIYSFLVIITPVGIGAAAYIWSSVGGDWHAGADLVALVNGVLGAIINVLITALYRTILALICRAKLYPYSAVCFACFEKSVEISNVFMVVV